MGVGKGRRYWVLWTVGALACGEDSPAQPRVDSGRAADSAAVSATGADAGSGLASKDAGASPTGTKDAGSCNDLSSTSSVALQAALSGASQSCTSDSDCKTTYLNTSCFHACGAAVSASVQRALDTASAEQDRTTCAEFTARGCVAQLPPCDESGPAACIGAECTEFQGSAANGTNGATLKAPLVLNNVTSGMSVELVVDQRLEVTLGTLGPSGVYGEPQLSSTALRFAQRFLPRLQNPGGPTTVFVFQAVSAGKVELTIPHTTREPFKLTVTIR